MRPGALAWWHVGPRAAREQEPAIVLAWHWHPRAGFTATIAAARWGEPARPVVFCRNLSRRDLDYPGDAALRELLP